MTTRREYLRALDRLEGQVEAAFLEAIREAVARIPVRDLEAAVAAGSLEGVLAVAGLTPAAMSMTTEAVRGAFIAGGIMEAPSVRIVFDIRNPRAEAWLSRHSSQFVTRMIDGHREAIREVLTTSMELGRGPRQTALDIVGRIDRSTGRRAGGIVGLSGPQGGYVSSARRELVTLDRNYFTRTRRDKRFDSIVMRSIRDGEALSGADIDRITGRYADRLLVTRGEAIARSETIEALNAGREQALQQALDSGDVQSQFVTRIWDATTDGRTRSAHMMMHGQRRAAGEPFQSPTGSLLMFPGDTSMGASAEDTVNCRCHERISVDFTGMAAAELANGE